MTAVQTGLEGLDVQPQGLGVLPQRLGLELLLIGEQAVVHLAAFPLCAGTPKRLGGFAGQRVDRLQREGARHLCELARRNGGLLKLGQRLTDVSGTEGSLVVGAFDEREGRLLVALGERVSDTEDGVDVTHGRALIPARLAARRQEFFHLL